MSKKQIFIAIFLPIAILPFILMFLNNARVHQVKNDFENFRFLLDQYRSRCDHFPKNGDIFRALYINPNLSCSEHELVELSSGSLQPRDPWGSVYLYQLHERNFTIVSFGSDRAIGGAATAEDLIYTEALHGK